MRKIQVEKFCDRCSELIKDGLDDMALDQIERDYPNKDLCPKCYEVVELSASLAALDASSNSKAGTSLKGLLELYGINYEQSNILENRTRKRSTP